MAEIHLTRAESDGVDFPRLCMQCGEPATEDILKKYTTDNVDVIPPPEPVGCFILGPILLLLKLFSWSAAKTMTVRTPLCHKHAHGWFAWSSLSAASITDDAIVIQGVSDQFARQWSRQRKVIHPAGPTLVKIRCRSCQALNDEAAKYCGQCGTAI